jgi:hypothetical protein
MTTTVKGKPDYTRIGITRQIQAMCAEKYEIGIYDGDRDVMIPRFWNGGLILKSIEYLRRQNSEGKDIFIRPQGSMGLVFFDDLDRGALKQLQEDGLRPAVVIQSSPDNFHGWIRVSDKPIPEKLATAVSKVLAKTYGGDENSADWRHYGRLAGFTNRKPKYIDEFGRSPFVTLSDGNGSLAPKADHLIAKASLYLEEIKEKESLRLAELARRAEMNRTSNLHRVPAEQFYEDMINRICKRYGAGFNTSKADWMIVNKMLMSGYSREEIYLALILLSPAVKKRGKYAERYITLTLNQATNQIP